MKIDRTRDAVARLVLEGGPQTARALAERLGLSAAAVRRHLDELVADGLLVESEAKSIRTLGSKASSRGRGRPARTYAITAAGRAAFPHSYDQLASTALRYLQSVGGDAGLQAFAEHRASVLEAELAPALAATAPSATSDERARSLAAALNAHGYAAGIEHTTAPGVDGVQICQHHCPIADVAHEFPQLCEAETRAFERLIGTNVQRLATIAHGDGICTTHIPTPHVPAARPLLHLSPPAQTGSRK